MSEIQMKNLGFMPMFSGAIPFVQMPGAKSENKEEKKCDCKKKDEFKSFLKDAWQKNIDMKQYAASVKKEKRDKFFADKMEMQELFIETMLDETFALPFAPAIVLSPKKFMKQVKEFEEMVNKQFTEQVDSFSDFRIQSQKKLYETVTTAVDDIAKTKAEAEAKAETEAETEVKEEVTDEPAAKKETTRRKKTEKQ